MPPREWNTSQLLQHLHDTLGGFYGIQYQCLWRRQVPSANFHHGNFLNRIANGCCLLQAKCITLSVTVILSVCLWRNGKPTLIDSNVALIFTKRLYILAWLCYTDFRNQMRRKSVWKHSFPTRSFPRRKSAKWTWLSGRPGVSWTPSPGSPWTAKHTTERNHRHGSGNCRLMPVIFSWHFHPFPLQFHKNIWLPPGSERKRLFAHR